MKRWRMYTWHQPFIEDEDGNRILTALSNIHAEKVVEEHNALVECAEALCSLMDLHTLDEEGLPMSRWYLESTKESMIVRARTALAKLENAK